MKKYLLLMCAVSAAQAFYAQNSDEISLWAASHPDVYIMSSENYNSLSEDSRTKINDHVVVYNETLTIEKLQAFDQEKSYTIEEPIYGKGSDAQELKDWRGFNPDVKIVTHSAYNAMSEEDKSYYVGALILIGEKLTIEDIRNYQTH